MVETFHHISTLTGCSALDLLLQTLDLDLHLENLCDVGLKVDNTETEAS